MQVFIARGEESSGPYPLEQVRAYLAEGLLRPDDLAYHEGLDGWTPLGDLMGESPAEEIVAPAPDSQPKAPVKPGAKRPRKKLVMAGIAVGLLVLGGGVAAALLIKKQAEEEERAAAAKIRTNQPKTEITPGAKPGPVTLPKPPDANETLPPDPGTLPVAPPIPQIVTNEVTQPSAPKLTSDQARPVLDAQTGEWVFKFVKGIIQKNDETGPINAPDAGRYVIEWDKNEQFIMASVKTSTGDRLPMWKREFDEKKGLFITSMLNPRDPEKYIAVWHERYLSESKTLIGTRVKPATEGGSKGEWSFRQVSKDRMIQTISLTEQSMNELNSIVYIRSGGSAENQSPQAIAVADTPSAKMIEASIRRTINKPEGDLTAEDFAKVTRLSVGAGTGKVSDLSFLANCPNLESIYAQSQAITNLAPLAKLPKLKDISISFNPVKDLTPLAGLSELQELWLQGAQVVDVTPLAGLTKLETLYLDRNQALTDLKPLAGLPALQHLSLYEMGALDLAPLANLPKLEKLNLAKLPPESLATLKPPAGLKELVFSPGPDSDLAALFGGIDALEKLRVTDARRMGLRKLVDAVKSHETLVDLGLPLGGVDDATPLADLPNLERLDLAGNFIEDLKPFAGLEQLNTLLLSGNRVKDVAPLVGCKKLGILWLQGNPVEDVTPLHDMDQLRSVTLRGTAVTEEKREALRQAIPNCFVDSKSAK